MKLSQHAKELFNPTSSKAAPNKPGRSIIALPRRIPPALPLILQDALGRISLFDETFGAGNEVFPRIWLGLFLASESPFCALSTRALDWGAEPYLRVAADLGLKIL